jgi:hypothetical protein
MDTKQDGVDQGPELMNEIHEKRQSFGHSRDLANSI